MRTVPVRDSVKRSKRIVGRVPGTKRINHIVGVRETFEWLGLVQMQKHCDEFLESRGITTEGKFHNPKHQ